MRATLSIVAVLALTVAVSAGTVNYKMVVDGVDADTLDMSTYAPGDELTIEILANVPDMQLAPGVYGGVLQYVVNLVDASDAVEPVQSTDFLGNPTGDWASTSVSPFSNYKGTVDADGKDVLGQAGAIPPGDFGSNYATFGAGPDVWSKVGEGAVTWNGTLGTLELEPGSLGGMLVFGLGGGSGAPENPTAANGDQITLTPEPATMSLLGLGALALIRRKR